MNRYMRFLVGAVAGFIACATILSPMVFAFLMPMEDILRWVNRDDTMEERMALVFSPVNKAYEKKIIEISDLNAEITKKNGEISELSSKLNRCNSVLGKHQSALNESKSALRKCQTEFSTLKSDFKKLSENAFVILEENDRLRGTADSDCFTGSLILEKMYGDGSNLSNWNPVEFICKGCSGGKYKIALIGKNYNEPGLTHRTDEGEIYSGKIALTATYQPVTICKQK
uniref:Uncharacterized protein n=1 Tax=Candidatus Kentrum sp. LPFa TaxID=2126335 RepID=A0A450WGH7_9GAMM|nr:MAG: hypothetical protein BECKLPF1236B_GA0070989_10914 [Candidatus Kentron sp. LPFa]